MTDPIRSSQDQFDLIQQREEALGVWGKCNSTFRVQENNDATGVLLIHGFGSSPYEMRGLEEHLFQSGHNVYSVKLAGHATNLEDFARSGKESWLSSAEEAYQIISARSSTVFLIGQSLGAAISLLLDSKVNSAGVVSLSCILNFVDRKIKFTSFKILRMLFPYVELDVMEIDKGFIYDKRPTSTISELLRVRDSLIKNLPNQRSPLLIMQSEDDLVVRPESAELIFKKAGSELKEILMFEQGDHRLTILPSPDNERLLNKIDRFIKVNSPEK